MDEQIKKKGRGMGNRNRLTMKTKEQLSEFALEELRKLWKHFPALETDKKVRALLKFAPYFLSKGNATKEEANFKRYSLKPSYPITGS